MRMERERSLIWFGAMLPHLDKTPSLDEFTGRKKAGGRRQTMHEMILTAQRWDAAIKGSASKLVKADE